MADDNLHIDSHPELDSPVLILGLSGWMDGGEVSTGSVRYLAKKLRTKHFASIDPSDFYIYNAPGPMEISALHRPHTLIEDGLVQSFREARNRFYASSSKNAIVFSGREPNLNWHGYADCIFAVAAEFEVSRMCFVGSISGLVPHTKAPTFYSSATDESMRDLAEKLGMHPTNYEGPASFGTFLIEQAKDYDIEMATIVAGVPAYVDGRNVACIEAAVKKVAAFLSLDIETKDLKIESEEFLKGLDKIVSEKPEFREHVKRLEEAYEQQSPDADLDEVRAWFERQGMRSN